ncbi:MAG: DNA-binding response regulator [Phycisphaeraceae bacterium]|nr:MAG: DNA-binding response regulator [Phycisphaeraceae bacterium]
MTHPLQADTVCIVDDDPAVRRAVERLLRSAGLRAVTFESAAAFLERQDPDASGCVVLDVTMPGLDGLGLQEELARIDGSIPIVFLTGNGDIPMSVRAMKGGAADFLTKPCSDEQLLEAIRAALEAGQRSREEHAEVHDFRSRLASLTPREHEVMLHVVAGKLNKQTAAELGSAEKTVKVHRSRVMQKLGASTLAELVRMAERAGLTQSMR